MQTYTVIGRIPPALGEDFDAISALALISVDLAILAIVA